MRYLKTLIVLSALFVATNAHAIVFSCGDTVPGGTASNYAIIKMTGPLSCSGTIGLKITRPYVSFDCQNYPITGANVSGSVGVRITASNVYMANCDVSKWRDAGVYASGTASTHLTNVQVVDRNSFFNNGTGIKYTYCDGCWVSLTKLYNNSGSGIQFTSTQDGGTYVVETWGNGANGIRLDKAYTSWHATPYLHNDGSYDLLFTGPYESLATRWTWVDKGTMGSVRFENGANHNGIHCANVSSVSHGSSTHDNTLTCP